MAALWELPKFTVVVLLTLAQHIVTSNSGRIYYSFKFYSMTFAL